MIRKGLVFFGLLCLSILSFSFKGYTQFSNETGFFPIKNFLPEDYGNYSQQNWSVVQDQRGIIYVGNNEGILEYDGIDWKLIRVSNESAVKSLAIDKNGRIYVGAMGELGYLAPDKSGNLEYQSLTHEIKDSTLTFNEVWYTHATNDVVYFQTRKIIFSWDGTEMKHREAETNFHTSFVVENKIVVNQKDIGLCILEEDEMNKIDGDQLFADKSVYGILPYKEDSYFVLTQQNGFYELEFNNDLTAYKGVKIPTKNIEAIEGYHLISATQIDEGTYAIGTWGNGLIIFKNGRLIQLFTKQSGLCNDIVYNQFLDKDKNLWLALSFGITKIEINSPMSRFNEQLGIEGTIESITRFKNTLYLATDRGLLYLPIMHTSKELEIFEQNNFKKLMKIAGGTWDLLNFKHNGSEKLIIATDDRIMEMDKNQNFRDIYACSPWTLFQSKKDESLLYVGLDNGLACFEYKNNQWEMKSLFPDITASVYNISEEENGTIWLGTFNNGVIRIDHPLSKDIEIFNYGYTNGIPENSPVYGYLFDDQMLFGTLKGIYQFNSEQDSFVVDDRFPDFLINGEKYIHRIFSDHKEQLWFVTFSNETEQIDIGYIKFQNDSMQWVDVPFNTISQGIINSFHTDDDEVIWLGGTEGLYRYDPRVSKNYKKDFISLIRLNIIGKDSTIFFGSYFDENGYVTTIQPEVLKPELKYKYNTLEFEFSAQNTEIEHPVLFSYKLEGYDDTWSEWSEVPNRYYTNLNQGEYTFKVRAKNIYNHESEIAEYEFEILPPWYQTIVAYISYVLLLIALIYLIVMQYTKYLRAVIREKTKEIREQKELVEHKNEEIMDSIKYAERIQSALLPPKELLEKESIEHFILFKPRDIVSGDFYWFKQIQDFTVIVAADCTGHGVPGAFVSMLGMAFLNEIAVKIEEIKASTILNMLRAHVIESLRQTGEEGESKDGMDIALYVIDRKNMKIQFSGANNPLILIREEEIIQVKGDRMPIGYHLRMDEFENHEVEIQKEDMLYTFSDGYQDQFGGKDGSKFKIKNLKKLLLEISKKPVDEQKNILDKTIENWKGKEEQIDDILLFGVRI